MSTQITKDPPSLAYPMYLSPPNFCYQRTSRSHIFFNFPNPAIHSIVSAKPHWLFLANPQSFSNSKTLSTLWKWVGCVWIQISSQGMTMGEGRKRDYNDFSLRMSSSLSKRWMFVVENLSRVFLSEWPLYTFVGNEGIYSIGKG